jgi:hypothetical protein
LVELNRHATGTATTDKGTKTSTSRVSTSYIMKRKGEGVTSIDRGVVVKRMMVGEEGKSR